MRTKLLLAALGIGLAGAVLPAAPASAGCIEIDGVGCVNPSCTVAAVVNVALEAAGSDERAYCTL